MSFVQVERPRPGIAVVTLDRPERRTRRFTDQRRYEPGGDDGSI